MDKIISDPSVTRALNETREFNALLADIGPNVSDEELQEMIRELDTAWGGRLQQPCRVTGTVYLPTEHGSMRYEDEEVVFNGAGVIRHYDSPDQMTEGWVSIGLQILVPRRNDEGAALPVGIATIPIDELYSIEFDEPSTEHVSYWLYSYYPEIVEEIDTRVSEEIEDEIQACLRLGDMRVNTTHEIPDMNTIDEQFRALKYLAIHTSGWFNFDAKLPYHIWVAGKYVYVPFADGLALAELNSEGMISADVDSIHWLESVDTPGHAQAFLKVRKVEEDPENDAQVQPWFVPLDGIRDIQPWRRHMT